MIVVYLKVAGSLEDQRYHLHVQGINSVIEKDNKLYASELYPPLVNDASAVGWFAVPEQPLIIPDAYLDEDGLQLDDPTVAELNLTYYTAETLPQTEHYAQVISIDLTKSLPVEVRRWFEPAKQWYDGIWCLVEQVAVEQYQDGKIRLFDPTYSWDAPQNKDSFVTISYRPNPANPTKEIPSVTGKVVKTW